MKYTIQLLITGLVMAVMLAGLTAKAQTYPWTTPTYIPSIRMPAVVIVSGVPGSEVVLNNINTVAIRVSGSCTSLTSAFQVSNDDTNWTTANVYPSTATLAASAITSITATGLYISNTAGMTGARINASAVSGVACLGTISGTSGGSGLPQ